MGGAGYVSVLSLSLWEGAWCELQGPTCTRIVGIAPRRGCSEQVPRTKIKKEGLRVVVVMVDRGVSGRGRIVGLKRLDDHLLDRKGGQCWATSMLLHWGAI